MVNLTGRDALLIGGGVLTFASGGVVGFFIARKKLETKYEEIATQEIAQAKQYYKVMHKKEEYESPETAVEEIGLADVAATMLRYQGTPVVEKDQMISQMTTREIHTNVFDPAEVGTSDFDFDVELPKRTAESPYIITEEEYDENEIERNQISLVYYEGDDVLVDEQKKVIPNKEDTIGEDNLQLFGHGSKDNNIVYVRNEARDIEFEITRYRGTYTKEVLGYDELKHSAHRKSRRFKMDWEE